MWCVETPSRHVLAVAGPTDRTYSARYKGFLTPDARLSMPVTSVPPDTCDKNRRSSWRRNLAQRGDLSMDAHEPKAAVEYAGLISFAVRCCTQHAVSANYHTTNTPPPINTLRDPSGASKPPLIAAAQVKDLRVGVALLDAHQPVVHRCALCGPGAAAHSVPLHRSKTPRVLPSDNFG